MGKNKFVGILFLIGICLSCSNDDKMTQEQEAQDLNQMFSEIENLALGVSCENSDEWSFTSYGSKACGGPVGYIAYSTSIDVELFLKKVEEHKIMEQEFNKRWGIISDCSTPQQPTGVICDDGSPVFQY